MKTSTNHRVSIGPAWVVKGEQTDRLKDDDNDDDDDDVDDDDDDDDDDDNNIYIFRQVCLFSWLAAINQGPV